MKNFGEIFTMLYRDSKFTQVEIAENLGVSHPTVVRWTRIDSIDAAMLEKICRFFKYPIVNFFDDDVLNGSNRLSAVNKNEVKPNETMQDAEIRHLKEVLQEKERLIQVLLSQLPRIKG